MGTIGRNGNDNIAKLRDDILTKEKDYLAELLKVEENVENLRQYKKMHLATIITVAKTIIDTLDAGTMMVQNSQIKAIDKDTKETLRKQLVLLMASIDDVQMANILELPHNRHNVNI